MVSEDILVIVCFHSNFYISDFEHLFYVRLFVVLLMAYSFLLPNFLLCSLYSKFIVICVVNIFVFYIFLQFSFQNVYFGAIFHFLWFLPISCFVYGFCHSPSSFFHKQPFEVDKSIHVKDDIDSPMTHRR